MENVEKSFEEFKTGKLEQQKDTIVNPRREKGDHKREGRKQEEINEGNSKVRPGAGTKLRSEKELKVYKEKLDQVILGLQKRWGDRFNMKREEDDGLLVMRKKNKITNKELEGWAKEFVKSCQNAEIDGDVTELKIDLNRCGLIADVGMKILSENIAACFQNLTGLHLNFSWCGQITDAGMKSFSENIAAGLKDLTSLHLKFSSCGKITGAGLESLSENISSGLKNLITLYLDFSWCEKITDAGLRSLSHNLAAGLKDLTTLSLDLKKCDRITSAGVEGLSDGIATGLQNLTTLDVNFSWSGQITDVGLKSLGDNIAANLKNLTSLSLGFSECQVSYTLTQALQEKFSKTISSVCIC